MALSVGLGDCLVLGQLCNLLNMLTCKAHEKHRYMKSKLCMNAKRLLRHGNFKCHFGSMKISEDWAKSSCCRKLVYCTSNAFIHWRESKNSLPILRIKQTSTSVEVADHSLLEGQSLCSKRSWEKKEGDNIKINNQKCISMAQKEAGSIQRQ